MGDILLTTPLLRLLKKKFPECKIHYVTKIEFSELLRNNPYIDVIHFFKESGGSSELFRLKSELQKTQYDVILDLHANLRSIFLRHQIPHRALYIFKKNRLKRFLYIKFRCRWYHHMPSVPVRYLDTLKDLDIIDDNHGPEFFLDARLQTIMKEKLDKLGLKKRRLTVCLCPGAGFATKRWPVEYYAQLAKRLCQDENTQIIVLGGNQDIEMAQTIANKERSCIPLAGQTTLMESACVLELADVVITNDTGLMHLANALKKKTVAIFGPTTRELGFFPRPAISRVVEKSDLSCRPCSHTGSQRCPKRHFRCMKEIQPESVFSAVMEILK